MTNICNVKPHRLLLLDVKMACHILASNILDSVVRILPFSVSVFSFSGLPDGGTSVCISVLLPL
uniref:Uncharacterized protein n=1 Tax=Anguilla anguilla TaxID=7936 RepID=A0A0E9UX44_ANGAN